MSMFSINQNTSQSKHLEKAYGTYQKFLLPETRRYIFGRTMYGDFVSQNIKVEAFIDDFTDITEHFGIPVIKSSEIPPDAVVLSAVVWGRPITVKNKLDALEVENFDYFAFYNFSIEKRMPVLFLNKFPEHFAINEKRYEALYNALADDESKRQLESIVNFRLSGDLSLMKTFQDIQFRQYFEDFLNLRKSGESFCDVGCFDGYTSKQFIAHCPEYESIYVFEPEEKNMNVVRTNLAEYDRIAYYECGLSDKSETLKFDGSGSSFHISETGGMSIELNAFDSLGCKGATFIKMDIEGGELAALSGAKNTIKESMPRLAVAAYHKLDDLIEISEYVLSLNGQYKVYLRHYTEGVTETALFFV